ncbi:MAG: nucleoside hydrolase [Spirochaetales bacterium]|nr:nucleoside hydrolase [Spirochaetales bacterium]
MKHKVIVDCDNTFGLPKLPIDDGQTIIYLLGRPDIEIVGITTTFGNSGIDDVYPATCSLMEKLGRSDIPVLRGASDYRCGETDASKFLVAKAAEFKGDINLIAIGTMANLKSASDMDPDFFRNLAQITTMGGYFYPLPYKGWCDVKEVNFSGDGAAAHRVFRAECPVTIMSAHICFALPFGLRELAPIADWDLEQYFIMLDLLLESSEFLDDAQDYLWDLLPAVYISYPDLFADKIVKISSTPDEIESGILSVGEGGAPVNVPEYILDVEECYAIIYDAWKKVRFVGAKA